MPIRNGFTLVEVLIALIIVSLVFFSCILSISEMTRNSQTLQNKTIASLVASNIITQTQLGMIKPLSNNALNDKVMMGNQIWYWSLVKGNPTEKKISEVIVTVKNTKNEIIYTMKGYISG